MSITPCIKCGASERYQDGGCKPCTRAYNAAWRVSNPDYDAAYRAANPEKKRTYDAAQYAANPEKSKARSDANHVTNPEARRIRKLNRRARKLEAGGKLSVGLFDKLFKLQRGKCACCRADLTKIKPHMDHIIPLAGGGPNEDWNMQLLCQPCNNQKHVKHPVDFMQQRGFLL